MKPQAYTVADALHLWWLASPVAPRLVGTLRHVQRTARQPAGVSLQYAAEWLAGGAALSEDLPLQDGEFLPTEPEAAAGAVDDARPARWGERVIRLLDRPARLSTLEYLYFAGDDRFGALGVSTSATQYLPRWHGATPQLGDVQAMHDLVRRGEAGEPVAEKLRRLITPGTTLGGARPKALLNLDGEPWVVKFAEGGDPLDSPVIEHAAMTLAARAGIHVCPTRLLPLARGHAVAVRRFDRAGGARIHALSAHVALRAAGQALGYQQMRVGRDGAASTLANALSEHRSFAISLVRAQQVVAEVAQVVSGWQPHFKKAGVAKADLALLAQQMDRPFLREQREAVRGSQR